MKSRKDGFNNIKKSIKNAFSFIQFYEGRRIKIIEDN